MLPLFLPFKWALDMMGSNSNPGSLLTRYRPFHLQALLALPIMWPADTLIWRLCWIFSDPSSYRVFWIMMFCKETIESSIWLWWAAKCTLWTICCCWCFICFIELWSFAYRISTIGCWFWIFLAFFLLSFDLEPSLHPPLPSFICFWRLMLPRFSYAILKRVYLISGLFSESEVLGSLIWMLLLI